MTISPKAFVAVEKRFRVVHAVKKKFSFQLKFFFRKVTKVVTSKKEKVFQESVSV